MRENVWTDKGTNMQTIDIIQTDSLFKLQLQPWKNPACRQTYLLKTHVNDRTAILILKGMAFENNWDIDAQYCITKDGVFIEGDNDLNAE